MDFAVFTSFLVDTMKTLWAFMLSNWLLTSALFAGLILPKFVQLIKKMFGR